MTLIPNMKYINIIFFPSHFFIFIITFDYEMIWFRNKNLIEFFLMLLFIIFI